MKGKLKTIIVGTGGMARHHLKNMLDQSRSTQVQAFVEISEESRQSVREIYTSRKLKCPNFYDSIKILLKNEPEPQAAFIITPHKYHLENATDCLNAGMDVLLEKPMVMNTSEAKKLIKLRKKTGKTLVVAFPGSLSPAVQKAKTMLSDGVIGRINGVCAFAHQKWKSNTVGTWRQEPDISGGGFLFDTGSHMINTMVDLMGKPISEVTAILDNSGTKVDINGAVIGRFNTGQFFSLSAVGDSISCLGAIRIFGDKGIIETGMWGRYLKLLKEGKTEYKEVPFPKSTGVWQQFIRVLDGKIENPCPPEIGLRFSQLMDMICLSAESGKTVQAKQVK
jgi:predicted dehydrogenase